jgi:sugar/nucleoside kinase (ribokinase family)
MPGRVVVCGNVVFDISVRPVEEVRWEATTVIDEVEQQLGGNGGTTSYTLARLGIPVTFATLVGHDATADFVLGRLAGAGVDLSLVQRVDAPTSIAISLIRGNGERALLYRLGAASEVFAPFDFPQDARHFHISAVYRMRDLRVRAPELLKRAREAGLRTSVDAQWDTEGEWLPVLAPSLPYSDFTLMNEDEARMLTGHTDPEAVARFLRRLGATNVVIKRGARGCWVNGESIPGYRVDAVDTTGAGDCFVGGFLAATQRGLSVSEAARFANAVGALSVRQIGATAAVPDWDSTVHFAEKFAPIPETDLKSSRN